MADWKTHINYNYSPAYHAYAYGLVFQPGKAHGNLASWGDPEIADLSNNKTAVTQAYYATAADIHEESPSRSPEQNGASGQCHYQGSGAVYFGDSQKANAVMTGDSTSDSETYISPDSWSSVSSREETLPHADPSTWIKKDLGDETSSRSPDVTEDVSSSLMEEPGNSCTRSSASVHVPLTTPKKPNTTAATNPKAKVRVAFSESQMNILVHRFSVQKYLPPNEMKNLAQMTGLTYKQVKTWFQNRRMKLRRHQKDSSWVSERYTTKDNPMHGTVYSIPPYSTSYHGESRPQLEEQYNQHVMGAAFKKTSAPQNVAFYLAAVGSANGSAGYPSWSSGQHQTAVPNRSQQGGWSVPQGVSHYQYNPNVYNSANSVSVITTGQGTSFESKDGEAVNNQIS